MGIDARLLLIMVYVAGNAPLTIFLLRSYMIDLPTELEDAARVDGANEFQVLTRIVIPLTMPGFLTVGLVVGLGVWNEFLLALTFIHDPNQYPGHHQLLQIRRPLRPRLGFNQRRRHHHHLSRSWCSSWLCSGSSSMAWRKAASRPSRIMDKRNAAAAQTVGAGPLGRPPKREVSHSAGFFNL